MKLVYLWYYVAGAVYLTYVSLYLHSIHLTGAQIGLVASISPLAGVALQPLWGLLSDRFRWRRGLLRLSLLFACLIAPGIGQVRSFVPLVGLVVALAVALSPAIPLSDATTLEWLSFHGGSYGAVRIYGSLGFLLGSLAAGPLLGGSRIRYLFPLYGLFLGLTFLVSLAAPRQQRFEHTAHRWPIGSVVRDRTAALFLCLAGISYATSAAYNTFFALYMHDLGASTTFIGLAAALASLSELPVMALSGRMLAWLGTKPLLLMGLAASAVRWLAFGLLHDYHLVLIVQLLHGLSFAAFYVAGVTFMDLQVPPQLRATGQTLLYMATFGLGTVLGANLFGALFDRIQARGMFLVAAVICAASLAAMAVLLPNRRVETQRAFGKSGTVC